MMYPRSDFKDKLDEFAERYISLDLRLGIIPEGELQDLSTEELRAKLMVAYMDFDYRGNVFDNRLSAAEQSAIILKMCLLGREGFLAGAEWFSGCH